VAWGKVLEWVTKASLLSFRESFGSRKNKGEGLRLASRRRWSGVRIPERIWRAGLHPPAPPGAFTGLGKKNKSRPAERAARAEYYRADGSSAIPLPPYSIPFTESGLSLVTIGWVSGQQAQLAQCLPEQRIRGLILVVSVSLSAYSQRNIRSRKMPSCSRCGVDLSL
jgi:hypothetical protein